MLLRTCRVIARAVETPIQARARLPLPTTSKAGTARTALPVLTASEVGTFVFCPEAWYLQRRGARQSAPAEKRLDMGIRAHREIGRVTDRVLEVESARFVLRVVVLLLAVLLVAHFAGLTSIPHP
jgi:hypothetical protein